MTTALIVLALVGLLCLGSATLKTYRDLKRLKAPRHMNARRVAAPTIPLQDEPPSECPTCATPIVKVVRGEFHPTGEGFKLGNTEFFACEFGHKWLGTNQAAMVKRRIEARKKLRAVLKPGATIDPEP